MLIRDRQPNGAQSDSVAKRAELHRGSASAVRQVFVDEGKGALIESLMCQAPSH
jgi:hypothetical protein